MGKLGAYIKEHHSNVAFWVSAVVSIGLLVGGFLAPPMGIIDGSVLVAVGELFAFAALGILPTAIKEGRSVKVKYQDTEIEVGSKDGTND